MKTTIAFCLLLATMLIVGCTNTQASPTDPTNPASAPEPTSTLVPTNTPRATPTHLPTPAPLPTLTLTPTSIPSCAEQYPEYESELDLVLAEWEDGIAVAERTSRANLNEPIANLQSIRREFERVDAPECAEVLHERVVFYMDTIIDTLISFMGGAEGFGDAVDRALVVMGNELYKFYGQESTD